ncbi:hypothetical protein EKK58_11875 [Candidatus Dependentiae bacterium]|nr:MAG: hypothetical protein EKK58_11875 [Candidatus Dependentiae bacterium]
MEIPRFIKQIKTELEENPVMTLTALIGTDLALAKVMDAFSAFRSRSAYRKMVNHNIKKR